MAAPKMTQAQGVAIASALYEILGDDHEFVVLTVNDDGEVGTVSSVAPHQAAKLVKVMSEIWSPAEVDNVRTPTKGMH